MRSTLPKYRPRAQFTGIWRMPCVYCGYINIWHVKPTSFAVKCSACEQAYVLGALVHVPTSGTKRVPRDTTIPNFGDDHYLLDPIPQAFFNRTPWRSGQRVHGLMLYEGIFAGLDDELPESAALAREGEDKKEEE